MDGQQQTGTIHNGKISGSMKRITKEYTVWNQFWREPKDVIRDVIYCFAIYGFIQACMDVWSWLA
jgi:hypothetical protein